MKKLASKQVGIISVMIVAALLIGLFAGKALFTRSEGKQGTGILKFTVAIGAKTYAPEPGKLVSVFKVPAKDVAGQTALVRGEYVKFDMNLDSFAISSFTVNNLVLYSSVVPQAVPTLDKELMITFDRERVTLFRQGKVGMMDVHADDADFGGILDFGGDLGVAPRVIDVVYTLGAGFTYTGVQPSVAGDQLLFGGPLNGLEMSDPNNAAPALLMSRTAQTSRWSIPARDAVKTRLAGPVEDNPKLVR